MLVLQLQINLWWVAFLRIFANQTPRQWLTLQEMSQLGGVFYECCEISLTALLVLAAGSWRGKEVAFLLCWVAGARSSPHTLLALDITRHTQPICRGGYWRLDIYISTYWDTQPISRPRVGTHSSTCQWHTDTLDTRQTQQTTDYN